MIKRDIPHARFLRKAWGEKEVIREKKKTMPMTVQIREREGNPLCPAPDFLSLHGA
jgi:hypothetical protein